MLTLGNTSSSKSTSATTLSHAHNQDTGSNRLLVATVNGMERDIGEFFRTVSSFTYNGASLTQAFRQEHGSTNRALFTEIWYLVNPATGSNTLSVTLNDNANSGVFLSGISVLGAAQTNTLRSAIGAEEDEGNSINIGAAYNDLIIGSFSQVANSSSSYTPGTGLTELYDEYSVASDLGSMSTTVYRITTSSGTKTVSTTPNTSQASRGGVAAAFSAVVTGPTVATDVTNFQNGTLTNGPNFTNSILRFKRRNP